MTTCLVITVFLCREGAFQHRIGRSFNDVGTAAQLSTWRALWRNPTRRKSADRG